MFAHLKMSGTGGDEFKNEHFRRKVDEEESVAPEPGVPILQATLFSCILEDCLIRLRILAECNNELRIMKTKTDMDHLLALKFHVTKKAEVRDLDESDLGSDQHKLNKLFADRKYFTDSLQQAYLDMTLNQCFSSLTAKIKAIEDRNEYRIKLTEEESSNKSIRHELMKNLRQYRNHIKSVIYDTNLTVENLKCQIEDTGLNSDIRSRFVDNWQCARTEQHIQIIYDEELGPSDAVNYYQNRSDHEQRIHAEVELLVNIFINETLTNVENWMNKYDTDMESQDVKIAQIKTKYQDATQRRLELEETYASHEVMANNWLQFKADRQAAINYREKMTRSALIVQAWWRGLLVRLQMGPYRLSRKQRAALALAEKRKKK